MESAPKLVSVDLGLFVPPELITAEAIQQLSRLRREETRQIKSLFIEKHESIRRTASDPIISE
jgi:hypothetical protein